MSTLTALAPLLERFFTQRLMQERRVSPHTIGSYRDTFRLFLKFTQQRLHKTPSTLAFEDIDAPLVSAFLDHLESQRGVSVRSRNLRLTAIHSFFRYAAFELPTHAAQIQRVLAIPSKRFNRTLVRFLTRPEVDALLAAPDQRTWFGRRDHAFILTAVQTGLRAFRRLPPPHAMTSCSELAPMCALSARAVRSAARPWQRPPPRYLRPGCASRQEAMGGCSFRTARGSV